MFGTYRESDVTLLLKDITGLEEPLPAEVREARIQAGESYANMLPVEYEPGPAYMAAFEAALASFRDDVADAVGRLAHRVVDTRGRDVVLVSLARAGTPVGILLKRYLEEWCGVEAPHYSVSIIRGMGLDMNAMDYILDRHGDKAVVFVDGWTGKGAIAGQLAESLREYYPGVQPYLAVLADPAGVASVAGTYEDFLIPSSCLNATVSGLLSRTFYRPDLIGPGDFHGACFYRELAGKDVTYRFIDAVADAFGPCASDSAGTRFDGRAEALSVARAFGVKDANLVKPGIGEATRVLLRRVPWKLLVRDRSDTRHLGHLLALADEKGVPVEEYPMRAYRACGLIRDLSDT